MVLFADPAMSIPFSVLPEMTFATAKLVAVEGVVPMKFPDEVAAM